MHRTASTTRLLLPEGGLGGINSTLPSDRLIFSMKLELNPSIECITEGEDPESWSWEGQRWNSRQGKEPWKSQDWKLACLGVPIAKFCGSTPYISIYSWLWDTEAGLHLLHFSSAGAPPWQAVEGEHKPEAWTKAKRALFWFGFLLGPLTTEPA